MASKSTTMLLLGVGAVGLLALAAAGKKKAAAAAPAAPQPSSDPPQLPPEFDEQPDPQIEREHASNSPPEPSLPAPHPDPHPDPLIEPPGPPAPVDLPVPSLDPLIEPPGPPPPVDAPPAITLKPVTVSPSSPSSSRLSSLPRAPGPPLEVDAGKSNVAPQPTAASAKRAPQKAAQDLLAYVKPILAAKKGSELGTKGAPNPFVKSAQIDMGGVAADGIYGPDTRARGKQLLNVTFPARA